MRDRLPLLLVCLAGCGRLAFDARTDGGERPDDGGAGDGGGSVIDALAVDAPPGALVVTFGDRPDADVQGVVADTRLSAVSTGTNFGTSATLILDDTLNTPLLRFDLSSIPTTATVFDAHLELVTTADATTGTVSVHRVLESWDEGTQDGGSGQANYIQRKPSTFWMSPGASDESRSAITNGAFMPSTADALFNFQLTTSLVQSWVTTPSTNFGLVFAIDNSDSVAFGSSEATTTTTRPLLRVTYAL